MSTFRSPDEDKIRDLLDDAVSDVRPRDALGRIQVRTAQPEHRRRPWIWGAGSAVVATAATMTAVAVVAGNPGTTDARPPSGFAGAPNASVTRGSGLPTSDSGAKLRHSPGGNTAPGAGVTAGPSRAPSSSADAAPSDATPSETATGTPLPSTVPVYYVGDTSRGPRLFREFSAVRADLDPALQAVDAALTVQASDEDYRSPWSGTGVSVSSVRHSDGVITVNLTADPPPRQRPRAMAAEEAAMAVQQVVYTVQGVLQSRDPVQLTVNGEPTDTLLGVPISQPLRQGDPIDVLAQVWIIAPAEDARVPSGFTVSGVANAFEANVVWVLKQGDAVVRRGFTTAQQCCAMAPYSFPVQAPPGDYTLVVRDTDPSGGEGFAPWRDSKHITVTE